MKIFYYSRTEIRVALTGGGTGGHIFPLVSIARSIKKELKESEVKPKFVFFGPDEFALETFGKERIRVKKVISGKFNRFFDLRNFFSPLKILIGFFQSLWHLYFFMPDIIISKGGYGSFPVVLASYLYRIPILVHESDSIPGLATRFSAKLAKKICLSFEKSISFFPNKKVVLTGNPIRFSELKIEDKEKGFEFFKLDKDKPILLVLGGSQGSQPLNDFILNILPDLISHSIQVIHQTGANNLSEVSKESEVALLNFLPEEKKLYHPVGFLDEKGFQLALIVADLVLSRSGSGTIFNLAFFGKPSILVPFPFASRDHQRENALEYAKKGGAIVIEQENLLPHLVVHEILDLIRDKEKLKEMSEKAKSFAKPMASKKIAEEALKLIL